MDTLDTSHSNPASHASKKRWLIIAAAVILLAALATIIYSRQSNSAAQAAVPPTVNITESSFEPVTIRVSKGSSVTWVNKDTQPHQVAADLNAEGKSPTTLNSGEPLAAGESYSAHFEETGTYYYHDQLNPAALKATVIVE